ncbi:hypothetical protein BDZ94DRAFT_613283 [Collybia nuda]|uniref:Transmembrane protein n=1 Tax=Collybia nuda TaxID=64659 RepID=A0A9P6CF22_9AGAR|nr:hypothetical protein BDZ94DRAFT_613283 [Collybia nuda]
MEGYLVAFLINGGLLAGFVSCFCCYRRKARKEREARLVNRGYPLTEYPNFRDRSASVASRSSLQPLRRVDLVSQEGATTGSAREPVVTPIAPEVGIGESDRNDEEPIRPSTEIGVEEQILDVVVEESFPPRLSVVIPETGRMSSVLMSSSPVPSFTHLQVPNPGDSTPQASTTTPSRPIHTSPERPEASSTFRRTISVSDGASRPSTTYSDSVYPRSVSTLPSYPGTASSTSPPAYSDLSGTRSRRTTTSSQAISNYTRTESVFEAIPDISRTRSRPTSRVRLDHTENVVETVDEPMPDRRRLEEWMGGS